MRLGITQPGKSFQPTSVFYFKILPVSTDVQKIVVFTNSLTFDRYFFGAMGCLLFFESFATFAAIAYGVIGGKTVAYCCLAYGLPGLNVGLVRKACFTTQYILHVLDVQKFNVAR